MITNIFKRLSKSRKKKNFFWEIILLEKSSNIIMFYFDFDLQIFKIQS